MLNFIELRKLRYTHIVQKLLKYVSKEILMTLEMFINGMQNDKQFKTHTNHVATGINKQRSVRGSSWPLIFS